MLAKSFNSSLVGISVLMTAATFFAPSLVSRIGMDPALLAYGAYGEIVARAFLFQFVHGGVLHLLWNGFFLLYFGEAVETSMGRGRYAGFFAFSTAVVTVSILFFASGVTIGISGFAMAVLSYSALRMKERRNPEYRSAFFFVFLNVAFGLFGNVSLVGHAAGAVAGISFRLAERIIDKR